MGFLSGLGNLFGIGGGGTTAKNAGRMAKWNPPQMQLPGYGINYQRGKGPNGTDSVTTSFDANNQGLRNQFYGLANQGMAGLAAGPMNNGGYGGVSNEMLGEFNQSNLNQPLPEQFYDKTNFDSLMQGAAQAGQAGYNEFQGLMSGGGAGNYQHWLDIMRQKAAPQENNYLQGGLDKQYLKGILGSTAGQYQTQGMMDSFNTADLDRQMSAYGMSQDALNQALQRGIAGTQQFQGMEGDAQNRGFLINQLGSSRAQDRFGRAMNMFGLGQQANQQTFQQNQALTGIGNGGISAQDQQLMSMLGLQGNLAAARSGANLGAGGLRTGYDMNQQGLWSSMINQATDSAGQVASSILGG